MRFTIAIKYTVVQIQNRLNVKEVYSMTNKI